MPYKDMAAAIELSKKGKGSLCSSIVTADPALAREYVLGAGTHHGRILVLNKDCAGESTGHGSPLPLLVHGGPGRAGGGEEMGGIRGVKHYMQRVAVQGSPPSGKPPCDEAGGSTTPWTTSMASIGQPAVVRDDAGSEWILVMQDVAPNGAYVAMEVPRCPDGSSGDVTISGVHQGIGLRCGGQPIADWFGDGRPDGSNPRRYVQTLKSIPLYVASDGRLFLWTRHLLPSG